MQLDDLILLIQCHRLGSMKAASRVTGLDYTTVYRRIRKLEESLGRKLLIREGNTTRLPGDLKFLESRLIALEEQVHGVMNLIESFRAEPEGMLTVTTTDTMAMYLLPDFFRKFQLAYSQVQLNILMNIEYASLLRREADVAICAGSGHPDSLVGYSPGLVKIRFYASKEYLGIRGHPEFNQLEFISPGGGISGLQVAEFLKKNHLEQIKTYANHYILIRQFILAGIGAGPLPDYLGAHEELEEIPCETEFSTKVWVLTHPDLRQSLRVKAFLDQAYEFLQEKLN